MTRWQVTGRSSWDRHRWCWIPGTDPQLLLVDAADQRLRPLADQVLP